MRNKKICITLEPDVFEKLLESSRPMGFTKVTNLVRYLALRGISEDSESSTESKTLHVRVDNYKELLGYVREKKFGTIEGFATFAMAQYMARFALTKDQKQRIGKNTDNGD